MKVKELKEKFENKILKVKNLLQGNYAAVGGKKIDNIQDAYVARIVFSTLGSFMVLVLSANPLAAITFLAITIAIAIGMVFKESFELKKAEEFKKVKEFSEEQNDSKEKELELTKQKNNTLSQKLNYQFGFPQELEEKSFTRTLKK